MNYKLSFICNGKLPSIDYPELICRRVSTYLGFDIGEIINKDINAVLFGGAVRDAIAGMPINDIDLIVTPKAQGQLTTILNNHGYDYVSKDDLDTTLVKRQGDYSTIYYIHSVETYRKDNNTTVQLIQPDNPPNTAINLTKKLFIFLKNESYKRDYQLLREFVGTVDLTCCGVGYSYHEGLFEQIKDAINHCKRKSFNIITKNALYKKDRTEERVERLTGRGWKNMGEIWI